MTLNQNMIQMLDAVHNLDDVIRCENVFFVGFMFSVTPVSKSFSWYISSSYGLPQGWVFFPWFLNGGKIDKGSNQDSDLVLHLKFVL